MNGDCVNVKDANLDLCFGRAFGRVSIYNAYNVNGFAFKFVSGYQVPVFIVKNDGTNGNGNAVFFAGQGNRALIVAGFLGGCVPPTFCKFWVQTICL